MTPLTHSSAGAGRCARWAGLLVLLPLCGVVCAPSATIWTNFDGLHYELVLSKTNVVAGEAIPASMVISNTSDMERAVGWSGGNICNTGIGEFLITNVQTGQRLDCLATEFVRANSSSHSLGILGGHRGKSFYGTIVEGYGLTNAGAYAVRAVGYFNPSDTSGRPVQLVTPPIIVTLSPKPATNSVAVPGPTDKPPH